MSLLEHTRVRLADYSKRQARGGCHARSHQRSHHGVWNIYRKYVKCGRDSEEKGDFTYAYELEGSIEERIETLVKKIYGGDGIAVAPNAKKQIAELSALGFDKLPICMAKTQYSFSDNMTLLGAPEGFTVNVKNVKVSAGAGFLVVLTGDVMTMPGLPKVPSAEKIDVDEDGKITGLF